MSWDYALKDEHVIIEDEVHAVVDLQKSGEVNGDSYPECDMVVWNKEEDAILALLSKVDDKFNLAFTVSCFGESIVSLDQVLTKCQQVWDEMLEF